MRAMETIVFHSRRAQRAQRIQGARHAIVGVSLILTGYEALGHGHEASAADWFGIVAGALLVIAFVRELKAKHAHHGVNWVDVFAALVTLGEAWHLHHDGKHALPIAYLVVAVILFAIGVSHDRIARLRRLTVDEHGYDFRLGPFRRVRGPWAGVTAWSVAGAMLTIEGAAKKDRVDLGDSPESDAVIAAFERAAAQYVVSATG